jgi:hypothetical protein
MNTLLHRKSPSIGGRSPGSKRSVELSEKHSLALLCFTTANGLLSFVAAMFTTMLTLSAGWRYFLASYLSRYLRAFAGWDGFVLPEL